MKIHHALERPATARPLVLALGFFDGFHLGHRAIVRSLLRLRRPGFRAAVMTFANHPATHLRPDRVPPLLMTVEERVNAIAAAGVDELYLLEFNETIARIEASAFCTDVLAEQIGVCELVVGENFRFGARRVGDAAVARTALEPLGIGVTAVAPVLADAERISSTRIRTAIASGDLTIANRLLGAPYAVRGTVSLGLGRGHDLGYPTANLAVDPHKTLPADGVYAISARHDGRTYPGLVSIGTNPTFSGTRRTVEAWLLDFKRTVYGEEMVLRDFRYIREQRTFASVDELLAQIRDDATHAPFPAFVRS